MAMAWFIKSHMHCIMHQNISILICTVDTYGRIRLIRIRLIRIAGSDQDFSPDKPLL